MNFIRIKKILVRNNSHTYKNITSVVVKCAVMDVICSQISLPSNFGRRIYWVAKFICCSNLFG